MVNLNVYDWSVFYGSFRNYFTIKSGLLYFSHRNITDVCLARYVKGEQHIRQEIVSYFIKFDEKRAWDELAFQYYILKDFDSLYSLLIRLKIFGFLYKKEKYRLSNYWRLLLEENEKNYTPNAYLNCNNENKLYFNGLDIF